MAVLIGAAGAVVAVMWLIRRGDSGGAPACTGATGQALTLSGGEEPATSDVGEERGEKRLKAVFRDRRIEMKGRFGRLLIGVVFLQTAMVAVLLVTQVISQRAIASGVPDDSGGTYVVPVASLVATAVSIAAGYCLALAAAPRIQPAAGLTVVAAVTVVLGTVPLSKLEVGGPVTGVHAADVWLRSAQLGTLALLCALALWNAASRRTAARLRPWVIPAATAAAGGAYYLLEVGVWVAYVLAGQSSAGTGYLVDDLGVQTMLLPVVLTVVVLLYSTDLLDWGEITAWRITYLVKHRSPRRFRVLTPLAALAVVGNVLRTAPAAAPAELAAGVVIAGAAVLLARRTDHYAGWSDDMRSHAVLLGAIVLFAYTTVLSNITSDIASPLRLSSLSLYWLVSVPLAAVGLAAGCWLLARGRAARTAARTLGLFLALAGMLVLATGLSQFLAVSHLPSILPARFSALAGVQLAVGLAVLASTGWALARRRVPAVADTILADLFVLLACLELVTLIGWLLKGITALGGVSPFVLASLFLVLGAWGLFTSGDQLNAGSTRYPRRARMMLLASYTVIANAIALYLGTLRVPGTSTSAAGYLTGDFTTPAGLGILGSAVVAMAFLLRGRGQRPPDSPAGAAAVRRPRTAAALAAGAVVVLVAGCGASAQSGGPYQAKVPGPGCDKNGAYWSVPPGEPVSARCLSAGLEVAASPHGSGDVQFLPPDGTFPRNYTISVQVRFSTLTDGCVSIYTRSSAAGHYTSYICTGQTAGSQDHQWGLERITPAGQWLLGIGELGNTGTYTLQATTENTRQRITINGATASGTDSALGSTKYIALGISNSGTQTGSAVFSDFTFTPLPDNPVRQTTSATALPTTTRDKVAVWYTDTGKPELALLESRLDAVGHAPSLAAQGAECGKLAAAVTAVSAEPQVPDPAAQPWFTQALTEYGKAAADCQAGATSHDTALSDRAAAEIHLAMVDIAQFESAIASD